MTTDGDVPDPNTHPLAEFLRSYQAARDLLLREQIEQEGVMEDGNSTQSEISKASAAVLDLESAISKLDEARTLFLVKVFTGVVQPSQRLVDDTVKLNRDLAKETVKATLPGVYVQIVTAYLVGAAQVISGNVPAAEGAG
jgi:hypothetical protein